VGDRRATRNVLGRRGGVVLQGLQRVVDARGREWGERLRLPRATAPCAVHDRIVGHCQIGYVEVITQGIATRVFLIHRLNVFTTGEREMQRNRQVGLTDLDRHPVVAQQQRDLLLQVTRE